MPTLKYWFAPALFGSSAQYSASWNDTAYAAAAMELHATSENGVDTGANNLGFTPAGSGEKSLIMQFIGNSAPGAISWTTSDTFSMSIRCLEDNAAYNDTLYAVIRVLSSNLATVRGVLFDGQINTVEFSNSDYVSRHCDSLAIQNNVSQQATDIVVIELGVLRASAVAGKSVIRMGDVTADPDLDLSDSDTSGNPWIEFTYAAGGGAATNVVCMVI